MVLITVDVKTNSNSIYLEKLGENHYLVRVKAPAKKGKANMAVLKLLKKHFKNEVKLIRGSTSSRKVFLVEE
jgi:uncharacterized protein (TIGR00251 family)